MLSRVLPHVTLFHTNNYRSGVLNTGFLNRLPLHLIQNDYQVWFSIVCGPSPFKKTSTVHESKNFESPCGYSQKKFSFTLVQKRTSFAALLILKVIHHRMFAWLPTIIIVTVLPEFGVSNRNQAPVVYSAYALVHASTQRHSTTQKVCEFTIPRWRIFEATFKTFFNSAKFSRDRAF